MQQCVHVAFVRRLRVQRKGAETAESRGLRGNGCHRDVTESYPAIFFRHVR